MSTQSDANTATVRAFCDLAFTSKEPAEAVARYVAPSYREHDPLLGDAPDALPAAHHGASGAFPVVYFEVNRQVAEGDLVVLHRHVVRVPGDRGVAVVDIFRLAEDKIVEHWIVRQDVPAT